MKLMVLETLFIKVMHFRLLEVDGFRNTFDKVNGYGKQVNAYYKIESLEESFDNIIPTNIPKFAVEE